MFLGFFKMKENRGKGEEGFWEIKNEKNCRVGEG